MRTAVGVMRLAVALLLVAGTVVVAQKETDPAEDWIGIFADEDWYRQQPGKEEVFRGVLEAVQPPEASTLMRHALYKLAGRAIYTGGRKLAALDRLVGSEIEIRGKAVEMNLEGQTIREVWPASARSVKQVPRAGSPGK